MLMAGEARAAAFSAAPLAAMGHVPVVCWEMNG